MAVTINPNGLLAGKVAVITGASRGIGEAIAYRYAQEGAKVVVSARTVEEGDHPLPGSINALAWCRTVTASGVQGILAPSPTATQPFLTRVWAACAKAVSTLPTTWISRPGVRAVS